MIAKYMVKLNLMHKKYSNYIMKQTRILYGVSLYSKYVILIQFTSNEISGLCIAWLMI